MAGYLIYVDRLITGTFEGRRWSIPAIVYAEALELYPGAGLGARDFETELTRLGYQRQPGMPRPGTYQRNGNRVSVYLRPFHFMERRRAASAISLTFGADRLRAIATVDPNGGSGSPVPLIRLEPPVIGSFFPSHGEDRLVLPPHDVPDLLREGLISVEDRKFRSHPGFDLAGIARAVWVNLREGAARQGGSTLTQQLVKSYFLDNRRTIGRKLRELFMAIVLDARYSKDEILNAYINEIYLGQDGNRAVHGFGLGARFYFNKRLHDLDVGEIATLISVIRGPSYYNPRRHPKRARDRRNLVLDIFHQHGLIDQGDLDHYRNQSLTVTHARGGTYYPAFMDLVRRGLNEEFDRDDLESEGLRVFTTLNPRLQDSAADALDTTIESLERGRNLPAGKLEGAVVVTRAQTGDVLALVGGRGNRHGFNRALSARRPVGSLIKPAVYLTALQLQRYHLATIVEDKPVSVELDANSLWQPANFDEQVHGQMPLVRALARSLNLATVHVGLDIGVDSVADNIGRMLGAAPPKPYPSLLLGALELTPVEVARLYGHFASGGFATPPRTVIAVLDEAGAPLTRYPLNVERTLSTTLAAQIRSALTVAMQRGTGARSVNGRAGVAGKTGTTNGYRDAWFAGFDDAHLSVIWMGRDDNEPVGLTGSTGPLLAWDTLMTRVGVTPLNLYGQGVRSVAIEYDTGLRAHDGCADVVDVLLPEDVQVAAKPGCGIRDPGDGLGKRIRRWFRGE